MKILVPAADDIVWSVASSAGTEYGDDDMSIVVQGSELQPESTIRTRLRVGATLEQGGATSPSAHEWEDSAALAACSLMLELISPGLNLESKRLASREAIAEAKDLASDPSSWIVAPLRVHETDYALWTRAIPGGVVAHANLGWATVAMWARERLPAGAFKIVDAPGF